VKRKRLGNGMVRGKKRNLDDLLSSFM